MTIRPAGWLVRLLLGLILIWGLLKYSTPFVELRRLKMEVPAMQKESRKLVEENKSLNQEAQDLATPEGLRAEAHHQGWLEPGERRLVFIEPNRSETGMPERPGGRPPIFRQMHDWARNIGEKVAQRIGIRVQTE